MVRHKESQHIFEFSATKFNVEHLLIER